MKIILSQRHLFNECKPMVQIDEWVQWDECDLSDCPPYREKGSMTAHGKFPKYDYEEFRPLPPLQILRIFASLRLGSLRVEVQKSKTIIRG